MSRQSPAPPLRVSDPLIAARLLCGLLLGVFVTLGLLWIMQYLIKTAERPLSEAHRGHLVDFVRVKREETVERKQFKPRKPPPPAEPPPEPPVPKLDELRPRAEKVAITAVPVQTDVELSAGGFSLGVGEGDYLPIVKVAPIYPRRALSRGIEGSCIVEYTVTKSGTVKDVKAIESECPNNLFKGPSVEAAAKFKYKPRVIDGQAVEVPGVRNKFTYRLEE